MKKIISLLLALVLLCAPLTLSAYAVEKEESGEPLLEEKFNEWTPYSKFDPSVHEDSWGMRVNYEELYYSYNEDTTVKWALIHSDINMMQIFYGYDFFRVGDIVLAAHKERFKAWNQLGLYLYDGEADTFCNIGDIPGSRIKFLDVDFNRGREIEIDELGKYSELYDALKEYAEWYPVGDVDFDGSVNILDATNIQRYLAGYGEEVLEAYNEMGADTDLDGSVSILDATRIQRYLVDLSDICGRYAEDTEEG